MINLTILLGALGAGEWILIVLVVVLLFGGKKIPELMRGLGQGIREFKTSMKENKDTNNDTSITK